MAIDDLCPDDSTPVRIDGAVYCVLLNCGERLPKIHSLWFQQQVVSRELASLHLPEEDMLLCLRRGRGSYRRIARLQFDFPGSATACRDINPDAHLLVIHNGFENSEIRS